MKVPEREPGREPDPKQPPQEVPQRRDPGPREPARRDPPTEPPDPRDPQPHRIDDPPQPGAPPEIIGSCSSTLVREHPPLPPVELDGDAPVEVQARFRDAVRVHLGG